MKQTQRTPSSHQFLDLKINRTTKWIAFLKHCKCHPRKIKAPEGSKKIKFYNQFRHENSKIDSSQCTKWIHRALSLLQRPAMALRQNWRQHVSWHKSRANRSSCYLRIVGVFPLQLLRRVVEDGGENSVEWEGRTATMLEREKRVECAENTEMENDEWLTTPRFLGGRSSYCCYSRPALKISIQVSLVSNPHPTLTLLTSKFVIRRGKSRVTNF